MTLFERLRAWLGSMFGAESSDAGSEEDGEAPSSGPDPRVVHRDDRPLETPSTLESTEPPSPSSERERVDVPDAETEAEAEAVTGETPTPPDTVSIPDAEARGTQAADGTAERADAGAETPHSPSEAERGTAPDDAPETGSDGHVPDANGAFACSVCGTTVDDPSEPCPLCRSTDVVPVADAAEADEPLTRGGRTTVSTADDDEAVDRLRDVRGDE
jgi:rubrerythrin